MPSCTLHSTTTQYHAPDLYTSRVASPLKSHHTSSFAELSSPLPPLLLLGRLPKTLALKHSFQNTRCNSDAGPPLSQQAVVQIADAVGRSHSACSALPEVLNPSDKSLKPSPKPSQENATFPSFPRPSAADLIALSMPFGPQPQDD